MSKLLKGIKYQSQTSIQKEFQISGGTLRSLADSGKIDCVRIGAKGKRLYNIFCLQKYLGLTLESEDERTPVAYARVSSAHQKQDLERQIHDLKEAYPTHEIISDIGSGLNFKRKGLRALLDRVHRGTVSEVVVAHKDRLARYGTELIEQLFELNYTRFVVLFDGERTTEDHRELSDDLLAVTTFFVARHNGARSRRRRKHKEDLAGQKGQDISNTLPNTKTQ